MSNISDNAWCIGRDFNSVLSLNDVGHDQRLACDSSIFNRCLMDDGLCNVGFCGQPFTWQRRTLRRRFDRIESNSEWSTSFGGAIVRHLPKLKSYHILY